MSHRSGLAGSGFYALARDLGKLTDQDEDVFWENEKNAVYETWKVMLKEKSY